MIRVEGFDDRDWNGYLTPALLALWKFIGIKVSQGKSWNPQDRYILQKQWIRAKLYGLLRIPFHYFLSPCIGKNAEEYGKAQATNFYESMIKWNNPDSYGWGELPPCIDVENRFVGMASNKQIALALYHCLLETEKLWGRIPIIYTASWFWDKYVHAEFVKLVPEYWKIYDLWEADPPPDTDIAGWEEKNSVQKIGLDGYYPGYGNGKIDIDETTQEWIDSRTNVPVPPPPPPPPDCIDAQKSILTTAITSIKTIKDRL